MPIVLKRFPVKLNKPQLRILRALVESRLPLCRKGICDAVAGDFPTAAKFSSWLSAPLGQVDQAAREQSDKESGYPSLITLGFVSSFPVDVEGVSERFYEPTDAGRVYYEGAEK